MMYNLDNIKKTSFYSLKVGDIIIYKNFARKVTEHSTLGNRIMHFSPKIELPEDGFIVTDNYFTDSNVLLFTYEYTNLKTFKTRFINLI